MKTVLLGIGALLAMTAAAAAQPAAQPSPPQQCWSNGVAVPCAPPAAAGYTAAPPHQYPPSWYYSPYDAPEYRCRMMCATGSN
jgi:hypothetical protein